jgi:hypothetical protein
MVYLQYNLKIRLEDCILEGEYLDDYQLDIRILLVGNKKFQ